MVRVPNRVQSQSLPRQTATLGLYLLAAFGLGGLNFLLFFLVFAGLSAVFFMGLIVGSLAWLLTVAMSIVRHRWRGLWTLLSAPLVGCPIYVLWYLSSSCPGGGVCL